MATIGQILAQAGKSLDSPLRDLFPVFGVNANEAIAWLQERGLSPDIRGGYFIQKFPGMGAGSSIEDFRVALNQPISGPPQQPTTDFMSLGPAPSIFIGNRPANPPTLPPSAVPPPVPPPTDFMPRGPAGTAAVPPPTDFMPRGPATLPPINMPGAGGAAGLPSGGGALPPWPPGGGPGSFPQTPPIDLPLGQQPIPFQPPPAPVLPTQATVPPELLALQTQIQSMLQEQQTTRNQLLSQLQSQIQQQEQTAATNQPMLDLAMQNIQSVLSGQAASPSLQGLVDAAFGPVENEGQRRLRQTAEEAAAARGFSLTDAPIGQPFLEENRRFLEQIGGQRAQAMMGLREQDVAFSQRVREFQEGLKQQALSNRMDVVRNLGTPEQAAQLLGNLGLGAQNVALQQFGLQGQQALSASDIALRNALGQAASSQGAAGIGLASQAQGFQQQLARQQASIQNQLAAMQALGDPGSVFGGFGGFGANSLDQQLRNALGLSQGLVGQGVNFGTPGFTQTSQGQQPGNVLGGLGAGALGVGSLLGASGLGIGFGAPSAGLLASLAASGGWLAGLI